MKSRQVFLFLLLPILLSATTPHAYAQEVLFVKTWGGSEGEWGQSSTLDGSANVYVTGPTASFASGASDVFLLKYDSSGNLLWQKTWGGEKLDQSNGIAVDSSGNIYVTGFTGSFGPNTDVFILKFDPSGNLLWQRSWGGDFDDQGWGISLDSSDNIYVTGYASGGMTPRDLLLLKLDSSGALLWQRIWLGSGVDWGASVALDTSGNAYVTGLTDSYGAGNYDVIVLKFDPSGGLEWQRSWGGTNLDEGFDVVLDSSGNIYLTGFTSSFGAGGWDVFVLKLDSSGGLVWQKTWGGSGVDWGIGAALDPSNNIYVTGLTNSFGAGLNDAFLLKFDTSGSLELQRTLGGGGNDGGWTVALDSSGDAYIAGAVSEAPPYNLNTPSGALQTPTFSLGTPSIVAASATIPLSYPGGAVTTPSGSETYSGKLDVALFKCRTPPTTTTSTSTTIPETTTTTLETTTTIPGTTTTTVPATTSTTVSTFTLSTVTMVILAGSATLANLVSRRRRAR